MAIARTQPRIDPEDPLAIPAAPIIEWYRIDASRRLYALMALGAVGMTLGMFAVTGLVLGHGAISLAWGAVGIALVIGSGTTTILGVMRVLWDERYVALRVDGALFVDGERRRFSRWDEIDDVKHDASCDAIVFVLEDGSEWSLAERFAGADNRAITKSAVNVRRKALFGLYDR